MPPRSTDPGWGAEFDRIARGELASSTEARLKELAGWGGFSSFLSPSALAVAAAAEIEPIGQVVGLSAGAVLPGYLRTTRPGQGPARPGVARRREHTGLAKSWSTLRTRALARLSAQAATLGANAVVGVVADRRLEEAEAADEGMSAGHMSFTGTAVRIRSRKPNAKPVLTLASPPELWSMLAAGYEPAGIAGAFASVQTLPSTATVVASFGRRRGTPNVELEDLTRSMYEVRRLAIERVISDARALGADGLLGIDLALGEAAGGRWRLPVQTVTVHVLASAVRRVKPVPLGTEPVIAMSAAGRRA